MNIVHLRSQVSVRRAALVAASRLHSELPSNTSIAQLWVTTALPMVSWALPAAVLFPVTVAAGTTCFSELLVSSAFGDG